MQRTGFSAQCRVGARRVYGHSAVYPPSRHAVNYQYGVICTVPNTEYNGGVRWAMLLRFRRLGSSQGQQAFDWGEKRRENLCRGEAAGCFLHFFVRFLLLSRCSVPPLASVRGQSKCKVQITDAQSGVVCLTFGGRPIVAGLHAAVAKLFSSGGPRCQAGPHVMSFWVSPKFFPTRRSDFAGTYLPCGVCCLVGCFGAGVSIKIGTAVNVW